MSKKSRPKYRWNIGIALPLGMTVCGCAEAPVTSEPVKNDSVSTAEALQAGDVVTVERVMHCRNRLLCNDVITRDEYEVWERAHVADTRSKSTFLARISSPAKNDVRYLAFFAAGQQDGSLLSVHKKCFDDECGTSSGITGQPADWKRAFAEDKTLWQKDFPIENSLVTEVIDHPRYFEKARTFAVAAWDAQFNYERTVSEKQDIEDAYFAYLNSKFDPALIRVIYLAGHSRGGCLVMRLAKRFNRTYPHIPVIVHSFDGVCTPGEDELGTSSAEVRNPISTSDKYGKKTNIAGQFSHPSSVFALHAAGGAEVLDGAISAFADVHTFSNQDATEEYTSHGWYAQQWFDAQHMSMDNSSMRQRARRHLDYHLARIACPIGQTWGAEGCEVPSCPIGGAVFDGMHCWLATPAGHAAFTHEGGLYWKPGPECPIGYYDGANCLVAEVPSGGTGFVFDGKLYYAGLSRCSVGSYDGANCLVATAPAGTKPFVYDGKLYTTPRMSACPKPSQYDGANCYLGRPDSAPFENNGDLYYDGVVVDPPLRDVPATGTLVHIQHAQAGRCLFRHMERVYADTCNFSREQLFWVNLVSDGKVEVRHFETGACLSHAAAVGTAAGFGTCGTSATLFTLDSLANGNVHLRGTENQRCLDSSAITGGAARIDECSKGANLEFRLSPANIALGASVTAQSTYPGYSAARINDGVRDTSTGGAYSWANYHTSGGRLPQSVELTLAAERDVSQVVVFTSELYPVSQYDIELFADGVWRRVTQVQNNVDVRRVSRFTPTRTQKVRIVTRLGPSNQTIYARLNEVEVY